MAQNNKELFIEFLRVLGKSDKTIDNYSSALSGTISNGIAENIDAKTVDIFSISDPELLLNWKEKLFLVDKFKALDLNGKNMYSAAFQAYINATQMLLLYKNSFTKEIRNKKFDNIVNPIFNNYLTAIRTKPFILLAGISGTGKSRLVRELAYMSCPKIGKLQDNATTPGNYCMVEVKPNWHDSSELIGYSSSIKNSYIITPFVKFLVKAMRYPEVPFFVCLDEMNLAPVEQYFAEYLSVLETRKLEGGKIISGSLINSDVFNTHEDKIFANLGLRTEEGISADEFARLTEIESELKEFGLRLPQNVIVVGTVNMDDTTHQFSRKVIDRAMTFEMNHLNFNTMFDDEDKLTYTDSPLDAAHFISDSVNANQALELIKEEDVERLKSETISLMNTLDEKLKSTPFRVAYRVQNELVLYYRNLLVANPDKQFEELFPLAADALLSMKVLPRIEGDEDMVGVPLKALDVWTAENNFTISNAKIKEMTARLNSSHYTSFWP